MKVFAWIIGLLLLAVIGVGVYVALNSGNIVKSAIEEFGPQYLGVSVQVDAVNLNLAEGAAQVKGLNLGNPEGFTGDYLMKLGEVRVVLDPNQVSETLVVMKQVRIDGADVAAIARGKDTNFEQLMNNIERAAESFDSGVEDPNEPEIKFIVDKFDFTNAKASLQSDVLGELALDLPDISLRDVGRKSDGVTGAELAEQLVKPISAAISREMVREGLDIDGVKKKVEDKLRDKIGSGLRGLTDRLKK